MGGNGPDFGLNVRLYIHPRAPHEVWAEVEVAAQEYHWRTREYGDTAVYEIRHIKVATFSRPLRGIIGPTMLTSRSPHYLPFLGVKKPLAFRNVDMKTDQIETIYNPCACGLLNSISIKGDHKGNEAGTKTGVYLRFNPILAW